MSHESLDLLVTESVEDSSRKHSCNRHEPTSGDNSCEEHSEFSSSGQEGGEDASGRRLLCGEGRVWAPLLSVVVASLPALLFGCTLGFPSPVLLNLMELDREELRFGTLLSDLFSVS